MVNSDEITNYTVIRRVHSVITRDQTSYDLI